MDSILSRLLSKPLQIFKRDDNSSIPDSVKYNRILVAEFKKAFDALQTSVHSNYDFSKPFTYVSDDKEFYDLVVNFKTRSNTNKYEIFKKQLSSFVFKLQKEHFKVKIKPFGSLVYIEFSI